MDPKEVLSGSRRPNHHRSRKQKDRVAKRAAHQQTEEEEDADRMEKIDFLENKAVYTASSVTCFWAGAVSLLMPPALKRPFCIFGLFLY